MKGLQLGHALAREGGVVLDLLAGQLHQVLVDDVADVLEVGGEREDLHAAGALGGVQLLVVQPGEVELDGLVQAVDDVVDRKSTRLNSRQQCTSRIPASVVK